jgi:hypothetical protein
MRRDVTVPERGQCRRGEIPLGRPRVPASREGVVAVGLELK